MFKPNLKFSETDSGVEARFEPIEDGYAQFCRLVVDDTPLGPAKFANLDELTFIGAPYNSPDNHHVFSVVPQGDWSDEDIDATWQQVHFQDERSDRIHLQIIAPIGYKVYTDSGEDYQLSSWALTNVKRFRNTLQVTGRPTWARLNLTLAQDTAGDVVLTLTRNDVIMAQGILNDVSGTVDLVEQNDSFLNGSVAVEYTHDISGFLLIRYPAKYNIYHRGSGTDEGPWVASDFPRTPTGQVLDDGQGNFFIYRSAAGQPAGINYAIMHSVDEMGNESTGLFGGGLEVILSTPPEPASGIAARGIIDTRAWGRDNFGQLGDGAADDESSPVAVLGNFFFSDVRGGGYHSFGLDANGAVWSWGRNNRGQLGANDSVDRSSPVSVVGNHSAAQISIGTTHGVMLKADGTAWAWGYNSFAGALGDNSHISRSSPVSVVGAHSFSKICGGYHHTLALKNGAAWAWGSRSYGALGTNDNVNRSSPVSVVGSHSFSQICAEGQSNLALKADGSAWGWGKNANGVVGDNTTSHRSSPVSVVGGHSFTKICLSTGYGYHSMALKSDGSVWAWGEGSSGELGNNQDGVNARRSSPVSVVGDHSFTNIFMGGDFSGGIKEDGSIWSWGSNQHGQLGTGDTTYRSSPVLSVGAGWLTVNGGRRHVVARQTSADVEVYWTASATPDAEYNIYDSMEDGVFNLEVPNQTVSGTRAILPALSASFTGLRYVLVRAVNGGVEEGSLQTLTLEYEDGVLILPRPPRPIQGAEITTSGLTITVPVTINTAEQKIAAASIEVFLFEWGDTPDYTNPDGVFTPGSVINFISQTDISATALLPGLYGVAVRTRSAAGTQSGNTDFSGPYDLGLDTLPDPDGQGWSGI